MIMYIGEVKHKKKMIKTSCGVNREKKKMTKSFGGVKRQEDDDGDQGVKKQKKKINIHLVLKDG